LFHPAHLATTQLLEARSPKCRGVGAGVPSEWGSARRYVHSGCGLVNKPPCRTHELAHFVCALARVGRVALRVTWIGVWQVWIESHSRRKIRGTRQQQPGLLRDRFPDKEDVIGSSPVHPHTQMWKVDATCPCVAGTTKSSPCGVLSLHVVVLAQVTHPEEPVQGR